MEQYARMRTIYKKRGESNLECLNRHFPKDGIPRTYAGRLDEMAEGALLILEGDECKEAKKHWYHSKTYRVSFLWGLSTDSLDALGCITTCALPTQTPFKESIYTGKYSLPIPKYSAKPVDGIALWEHTQKENIVTVPLFSGEIYSWEKMPDIQHSFTEVVKEIKNTVACVSGNFRKKEIIDSWDFYNKKHNLVLVNMSTYTLHVSAGFYIRSLAQYLANENNTPCMIYTLKRMPIDIANLKETQ
ncbi:MAG: hypothetical protein QM526_02210 [Alphaproteobacteria bacterium]|nr:hypothetical protein [Alphaproteobacteria bacterium]